MNSENFSSQLPHSFYTKVNQKMVFVPCPPESKKCIDLQKEIFQTKKLIESFLIHEKIDDNQYALTISEKILEQCDKIPVHEITCQIQEFKHYLQTLFYHFYAYHLQKITRKKLENTCQNFLKNFSTNT